MFKMMTGRCAKASRIDTDKISSSGFTLLELSVVITIIGLAIGGFITGYNNHLKQKNIDTTNKRTEKIVEKLFEFRNANGRYPCPASFTATRDTADYGKEICTASAAGTCDTATGICTQRSQRTDLSDRNVLIGAIPFRSLNIPEDESYDAYGSRIVIAVTKGLTDAATFRESQGGISVENDKGVDIYTPHFSGQFFVASPGKNRRGAYTRDGKQFGVCAGAGNENFNCDYLNSVLEATFRTHPYSERPDTGNYFDDIVKLDPGGTKEAWRWQGNQTDMVNMKANKVILGMRDNNDPVSGTLNVLSNSTSQEFEGSVNVRGELKTTKVCDPISDTKCLVPKDLEANCPPGYYLVGYLNGKSACEPVYYGCEDRQYLDSITSDGKPVCKVIYDGDCGTSNGNNYYETEKPNNTNRCTELPADPSDTGMSRSGNQWTWTCTGSPGGRTSNCSANVKINGACGTSSGKKLTTKPTSDLCGAGNASAVSDTAPFSWTCNGINGGTNEPCGTTSPDPVNGTCGSSENACVYGSLIDTADTSTTYNWSCKGEYSGSTASCTAPKPVLVNGVCGSTVNACTSGTLDDTADDTNFFNWKCTGQNGGSTSTCQLARPPVTACTPGP